MTVMTQRRGGRIAAPQITATLAIVEQRTVQTRGGFARPGIRISAPRTTDEMRPLVQLLLARVAAETGLEVPIEAVRFDNGRFTITAPPRFMQCLTGQPEVMRFVEPRDVEMELN